MPRFSSESIIKISKGHYFIKTIYSQATLKQLKSLRTRNPKNRLKLSVQLKANIK